MVRRMDRLKLNTGMVVWSFRWNPRQQLKHNQALSPNHFFLSSAQKKYPLLYAPAHIHLHTFFTFSPTQRLLWPGVDGSKGAGIPDDNEPGSGTEPARLLQIVFGCEWYG